MGDRGTKRKAGAPLIALDPMVADADSERVARELVQAMGTFLAANSAFDPTWSAAQMPTDSTQQRPPGTRGRGALGDAPHH